MPLAVLSSFKDNIKGKLTNPYFGALVTVWLFHNRELLFALYTFDKDSVQVYKESRFNTLWANAFEWQDWLYYLFMPFLVLIVTYVLRLGSRYLTQYYNKRNNDIIAETEVDSMKPIAEYKALEDKYKALEKDIDAERDKKITFQTSYESKNKQFIEANDKVAETLKLYNEERSRVTKLTQEHKVLTENYNKEMKVVKGLRSEIDDNKTLFNELQKKYDAIKNSPDKSSSVQIMPKLVTQFQKDNREINEISKNEELMKHFRSIGLLIQKKEWLNKNDSRVDDLILRDLIVLSDDDDMSNNVEFTFTEKGLKVWEIITSSSSIIKESSLVDTAWGEEGNIAPF